MTSKELAICAGAAVIVAVFAVVFFGWMGGIVFTLALVFVVLNFFGLVGGYTGFYLSHPT